MADISLPDELTIDDQLRWVIEVLNERNLPYWLDSGSLLGIVRDGRLPESDHDIDISVRYGAKREVQALLPTFREAGYTVTSKSYYGDVFTYLLAKEEAKRHIDIKLFKESEDYLWSYSNTRRDGSGPLWWASLKYYRFWKRYFNTKRYPTRPTPIHDMCTWWLPRELIEPTVSVGELEINVPTAVESYLEYRFGDWEVPIDDWNYIEDDGGLVQRHPRDLL